VSDFVNENKKKSESCWVAPKYLTQSPQLSSVSLDIPADPTIKLDPILEQSSYKKFVVSLQSHNETKVNSRSIIKDASTETMTIYTIVYFIIIHLRWRFCLVEKSGGRICFDGRSQTLPSQNQYPNSPLKKERTLTQHRRMQRIHKRNQHRHRQNNQQNMCQQEVRRPKRHLHSLHYKLSRRLRHRRGSQPTSVPFTSPPGTVRFVMFEFTSEEDGDDGFLNGPLDRNDRDDTQNRVGGVP